MSKRSKRRLTPTSRRVKRAIWYRTFGPSLLARCHWCPRLLTFNEATLDHEPPLAEGGSKRGVGQAVIACEDCNKARGRETDKRLEVKKRSAREVAL